MRHSLIFHALLALVVFPLAKAALASEPLRSQDFERLHSLIKPQGEEEQWTKIPWRTSLWEARVEAAREGKPILLWEMDGHPLGCT